MALFGSYGSSQPSLSSSNETQVFNEQHGVNQHAIALLDHFHSGVADEDTSVALTNGQGGAHAYAAWS
jgi:hypothetical protein